MAKKYCNRCSHDMRYDETKNRWFCTNPKCVKYKKPPQPEPQEQDESATDTNVGGKE